MDKIDKIGFFDKETGESLDYEVITSIQKEEYKNRISSIYENLKNNKLENVSLDDLEIIMKLHKRSIVNVMIDFSNSNERYFIIKDNFNICKDLDKNTKSMLYEVSQLITHDNTIVTRNNIVIDNYSSLCNYLDISYDIWKRSISQYNKKYNIIKKEKINNKWYLILNPLFAKSKNFKLNLILLNLYFNDIVNNINYFIKDIDDVVILELLKQYIHKIEYTKIKFKLSPDKYYEIINEEINEEGIYILIKDDNIVYIGKSKNIKNRVKQHKKDKDFNRVKSIIFKNYGNINLYEPYLIQKYKPKYNRDLLQESNIDLPEINLKIE